MKRQKYILTIDNPCDQEWSSMTKTDTGKFCSQCSKTVIDFTQLTDNEIIQIVEQTSDTLCGRLTKQQLNRILEVKQPKNNSRLYKILAGLLVAGAVENASATNKLPLQTEMVSIMHNEDLTEEQIKIPEETTIDSLKNVVHGNILEKYTKESVSYALVSIKDTKIQVVADIDGKFSLVIPDNVLVDEMTLVITNVGYEKAEIIIYKKDLPITKEFLVISSEQIISGGVCFTEKRKWWQRKHKHSH